MLFLLSWKVLMMIIVAEKMFCMLSYPACTLLYLYVNFLACRNRHWRTKLIQRNPPLFVFFSFLYQSHKYFIFNDVLSLYIVAELVIFLTGRHPVQFSSVAQSCLTLQPHGLQHARLPCQSPTPRTYSNSCPLS